MPACAWHILQMLVSFNAIVVVLRAKCSTVHGSCQATYHVADHASVKFIMRSPYCAKAKHAVSSLLSADKFFVLEVGLSF